MKSRGTRLADCDPEAAKWAAAVVKKATPKIVESLVKAAQQCGNLRPKVAGPSQVQASPEEPKDESLAAMLLRLLREGEGAAESASPSAPGAKVE